MITVTLKDNESFGRTAQIHMPGYALPPPGRFLLELRRDAGAPVAHSFSTDAGSLQAIGVDAPSETIVLAMLATQQEVAELAGVYIGDLLYVESAESSNLGAFLFDVQAGVTQPQLAQTVDYASLAAFSPLRDIADASAATVLALMQRGATGPAPFGALAPWASNRNYAAGPPASFVTHAGAAYLCSEAHVSGAAFDPSKWTALIDPDWGFPIATTLDFNGVGGALTMI
jgi:hypothetical protein